MQIGILALQGGYEAHARMLTKLNINSIYIREPSELNNIQGLIIPGGESSTFLKLLNENGFFETLQHTQTRNLPIFGTCAGAILLAKTVTTPAQKSLGFIDITIARNAYGRQLASRIVNGECTINSKPLEMVFIRAPRISTLSLSEVKVIAKYQAEPVCVQQNHYLAATFHPELTNDTTLHQYFMRICEESSYFDTSVNPSPTGNTQ